MSQRSAGGRERLVTAGKLSLGISRALLSLRPIWSLVYLMWKEFSGEDIRHRFRSWSRLTVCYDVGMFRRIAHQLQGDSALSVSLEENLKAPHLDPQGYRWRMA
jgi:hypothetical protein